MSTSELPSPKTSTVALIAPLELFRRRFLALARGAVNPARSDPPGTLRRIANRPGLDKLKIGCCGLRKSSIAQARARDFDEVQRGRGRETCWGLCRAVRF